MHGLPPGAGRKPGRILLSRFHIAGGYAWLRFCRHAAALRWASCRNVALHPDWIVYESPTHLAGAAAGRAATVSLHADLAPPAIGHGHAPLFRTMYFVACMAWTVPLALLQRALWRRATGLMATALILLGASYPMSVLNALLAHYLALYLGIDSRLHLDKPLQDLDGCWLALIAFSMRWPPTIHRGARRTPRTCTG